MDVQVKCADSESICSGMIVLKSQWYYITGYDSKENTCSPDKRDIIRYYNDGTIVDFQDPCGHSVKYEPYDK